jgi:transposase-like protein
MSRSTISTFQLAEMFPDQETARRYFEGRRWPTGIACPFCQGKENITPRKDGFYRCNPCQEDFTVRTGTIFERSHVPLHRWLYAMYIMMTARKGISSLQLGKEIGVTQKTAWFIMHRIREACGGDPIMLSGIVEVDECFIGGKDKNKHEKKRPHVGRGAVTKTPVIGMREREGRTKMKVVETVDGPTMKRTIERNIEPGAMIHTDEGSMYRDLRKRYARAVINHSAGEYSKDGVTTNGVESVWSVLKRGVYGTFHHVSDKHLGRYVDEFSFRLNEGDVKRHTLERLASLASACVGQSHLTYAELIA